MQQSIAEIEIPSLLRASSLVFSSTYYSDVQLFDEKLITSNYYSLFSSWIAKCSPSMTTIWGNIEALVLVYRYDYHTAAGVHGYSMAVFRVIQYYCYCWMLKVQYTIAGTVRCGSILTVVLYNGVIARYSTSLIWMRFSLFDRTYIILVY